MSPTILLLAAVALLATGAVVGALLAGASVRRARAGADVRRETAERAAASAHEEGVSSVLAVLRSAPVVLDSAGVVVSAPASAYGTGIVRGRRLAPPELVALAAAVREDGEIREAEVTLEGSGGPERVVGARIGPLGPSQVLLLLDDRTQQRLVEAVRRDFVANVSHELKTPVGAIRLLSEAVQDAADDPDAVQRFAQRMHRESDRLTALVQQIIDLSRLQADDPLREPDLVAVDDVVAEVVDAHSTDADARGITIAYRGDPGLRVHGDPDQLALAIGNLLSNAIAYSPDGSRIAMSSRSRGDRLEVSVTDQGIGIAADEIDRIFERFYRCDPARQRSTGGSGLGLSIVKHVVASHGGDVRVWSTPDAGSTFTLSFPRHTGGDPTSSEAYADPQASEDPALPTLTTQETP